MTELRKECVRHIERFAALVPEVKDVLEVGIAGDVAPGGNYYLWPVNGYKTMDIDPQYGATFTDDITNPKSTPESAFDLVIVSNTIEHTYEPLDAIEGAKKLLRKGGYAIFDCPWQYPYHAEDNFPDCWRISKDGMRYLVEKAGFTIVSLADGRYITSVLVQKNG